MRSVSDFVLSEVSAALVAVVAGRFVSCEGWKNWREDCIYTQLYEHLSVLVLSAQYRKLPGHPESSIRLWYISKGDRVYMEYGVLARSATGRDGSSRRRDEQRKGHLPGQRGISNIKSQ